MKNLLPAALFVVMAQLCPAQISTRFYAVPNVNTLGVGAVEAENGDFFLLLNTYCYTPGSIVIDGCPRGYHLFRLDNNQDSLWNYPIDQYAPDLAGLQLNPAYDKVKIFGATYPTSGECNGSFIFAYPYAGISSATVTNLDYDGNFLDSTDFSVGNCFMNYGLARPLPGKRTLLGTRYYERTEQGPVTYAEARYFVLDSLDQIMQSYTYPNENYFFPKSVVTDSLRTVFVHYNLNIDQFELVKINETGAEIWSKPYQGLPIISMRSIQQLVNGDLILQGVYYDNQIKSNVVTRFDSIGNLIWSKAFVGSYNPAAVGELANGNLLFGESLLRNGSLDIFLRLLTPAGDSIDSKWYALSPGADNIRTILPQGNNFYLMGDAFGGLDSVYGPARAFLAYDDFTVSGAAEPQTVTAAYRVFPNPVSSVLSISEVGSAEPIEQIVLYDQLGHPVLTVSGDFRRIDVTNLSSGVYWMRITGYDDRVSLHKVVKM